MKRALVIFAAVVLAGHAALAVEVRLRDGTVFEAADYTLTGSYLMVTLPGGGQVAYDVADVDLDALKAAEAAANAPASPPTAVEPDAPGTRGLTLPPANAETSGVSITDHDVRHTWSESAAGEEGAAEQDQAGAAPSGPPPGFEQGGGVVLSNLRVTGQGDNRWVIEGDVVNRTAKPVSNVRVQLQTMAAAGEKPWSAEIAVTNQLPPDEVAVFSHSFSAPAPEGRAHPDVRASVLWMQDEGPRQPARPPATRMPGPVGPVPTPEI